MGLFIGASILTILELFDYIYEVRSGVAHVQLTCPVSRQSLGWGEQGLSPPTAAAPPCPWIWSMTRL